MIKKGSLLLLLSAFLMADESFDIEEDFLSSLDNVSQIATKNKLNIDKTTSLITTLDGKKLQKLGVNSVYDALRYIPGIELTKEASGIKHVIFRGSITKGEVKFLVDGVEVNNAYRASFYYFLDFPIELISRIEVLRGSASVIHGSGAISGVINIITKSAQNNTNELFFTTGTHHYAKGGTVVNLSNHNYKLSLDAYYQKDNKEIDSTDQRLSDYSAGINYKYHDIEFTARLKNSLYGGAYGLFGTIDTKKDKYDNNNQSIFTNLKYKLEPTPNNKILFEVGYSKYDQRIEDFSQAIRDNTPGDGDLVSDYKEHTYTSKIEFKNSSIDNNNLLIGAVVAKSKALKTDLYGYVGEPNIVNSGLERDIYSFYIKDNYLLIKDINIDFGMRYDKYSDFGNNLSPNVGMVYRANDEISLKLKHSHAFRAPSWTELYGLSGNADLEAETSDTTEFGFIYVHSEKSRLSLNLYHSYIKDYIERDQNGIYSQNSRLNLNGAELDFSHSPLHNLEFDFLASYTDMTDKNGKTIDEINNGKIAKLLTTSSLIYTSASGFVFGSTLRYKNTEDMDNKVIFDQSVSYNYKEFNIELVVKNMFNSEVLYYDEDHDTTNPIKDAQRVVLINGSWEF